MSVKVDGADGGRDRLAGEAVSIGEVFVLAACRDFLDIGIMKERRGMWRMRQRGRRLIAVRIGGCNIFPRYNVTSWWRTVP